MKKIIVAILVIAVLGIGYVVYSSSQTKVTVAPQTIVAPAPVKASTKVASEAKVVPIRHAALSFREGGIVSEIPVALGDQVKAGQVLVQLENRQLQLQLAKAEADLASAQAKLNQLKSQPLPEELAAAQQKLVSAQAAYDRLLKPDTNDLIALKSDVEKTDAEVKRAQAAYDRIGGDSNPFSGMSAERAAVQKAWIDYTKAVALYQNKLAPQNADVQEALANIESAKSQLAKLKPTQEDLAAAQATADAARAARDLIAEQIKNTKLVAPFNGTITSLDIKAGEYASAGTQVLRLADTSSWQVETTDLTELNIVKVREGTPATITLDAIPGLELKGKVTQIKTYGENKQGDIVYAVTIRPDQQDERLRWNMTAQVNLDTVAASAQ